ncbi:MAG: hypothetical protein KJ955_04740 [Nanoarchaeota archaeon]|nr:hypothetical protein [Nanoarchaeota archaeon]
MISALSIGVVSLAAALNAAPANDDYSSQFDSIKITVADERPHYLQSLPSQRELARMTPLERLVESGRQSLQSHLNDEADLPPMVINGCATAVVDVNGANLTVLFPLYTDLGNGRWRYLPDGAIVNGRLMIQDMQNVLDEGVGLASDLYEPFPDRVNALITEWAPDSEALQNNQIEERNLIFNDIYGRIDDISPVFLRDGARVFMAPAESGALAITQLESNTILYTPLARKHDAIWGAPYIMAHELVHNNIILQGIPSVIAIDPELQAFTMSIENRNDPLLFLAHGYGRDMREKARLYFGFDSNVTLNDLIEARFDSYIYLNEQALAEMAPKVAEIAGKMQNLLMDSVYPEYQSFRHWWLLTDFYFQNDILPLEVILARDYEPSILSESAQTALMQKQAVINSIILQTVRSYDPFPSPPANCPSCELDPDSFKKEIFDAARAGGFNRNESEVIYHMALRKIFITPDEKINYGAMGIPQMLMSVEVMMYIMDDLMQTTDSFRMWTIAQQENVKKNYEIYDWLRERLVKTSECVQLARRLGKRPSLAFTPDIFDPAVENPGACALIPDLSQFTDRFNILRIEVE